MGFSFDGFVMPEREELGDTDPRAKWEKVSTRQAGRPLAASAMYLVLQDTDTAELFTFTTSSRTGRRAVGNLLAHYTRMQKTHPDELPVDAARQRRFCPQGPLASDL